MSTLSNARLGSANTYDAAVRNITTRQSALSALQENLTSGKRVVRASDDPTSAAIAERALTRISRITTDQRALASQVDAITQAESTLGDVTDALQRFRELTVSAGNGANSPAERKTIAQEMQGLRDQIYALANQQDTNGQPLFSALGSALKPFVGPQAGTPDYTFDGLPGQPASTGVSIAFALDGDAAFMLQPERDGVYNATVSTTPPSHSFSTSAISVSDPTALTGDAYTITIAAVDTTTIGGSTIVTYDVTPSFGPTVRWDAPSYPTGSTANIAINNNTGLAGLSMTLSGAPVVGDSVSIVASPSLFSVLDNAIKNIGNAADNNSAAQAVSQTLNNIDIGMQRVSAARGQAGELLNRADRISGNQDKRSIQMEADRSRAEDLDMAKGISDFQKQQTGYQAALQTYAQIQKLSLFDFIR